MLIQKEFPFGNPTIESNLITAIICLSITLFAATEVIKLYKTDYYKMKHDE